MKLGGYVMLLIFRFLFSNVKSCSVIRKFTIEPNITMPLTDYTVYLENDGSDYCFFEFSTETGYLIDLFVNYKPFSPVDIDCWNDFILFGNDDQSIGENIGTSYEFCGELSRENIVSRYNYLWVKISYSRLPKQFDIEVTARPKVKCNSSDFECSPTQCIPSSAICDGTADCYNSRDEYCLDQYQKNDCFYCFDGTCINPVLPRYHNNWGKELWYLCDGFEHCPDGTDEKKLICYRIDSRVGSMLHCVPTNSKNNQTVMMWNTVQCNGVQDCRNGEDESKEICSIHEVEDKVYRPTSVIIIICFVVISIIGTLIALKVYKVQQNKRIVSERNQTETSDTQLQSERLTPNVCSIDIEVPALNGKFESEDSLSLTSSNPGTLKSYQEVKLESESDDENRAIVIEYRDEKGVRCSDL